MNSPWICWINFRPFIEKTKQENEYHMRNHKKKLKPEISEYKIIKFSKTYLICFQKTQGREVKENYCGKNILKVGKFETNLQHCGARVL